MGLLKCDVCGGKIIVKEGGQIGECECCGANYTLERMCEIASGVKVSVTGSKEDVEQWKALVKTYLNAGDFGAAESVVNRILGAVPSDEYANDIYSKLQDWKFCEVRNGVLVKYTGRAELITIPDCITSIGRQAFCGCTSLTSVTIPDSVTNIGELAFSGCKSLTEITIPDSVTSIGDEVFWNCTSLTSVTIPDSVISIGYEAFYNCTSLTSVTIPDSVTSIGDRAFEDCASLTSVTIPDSVTSIGGWAFKNCTSLTSVTIGGSGTSIGRYAFEDCTSLTEVTILDSVTSIGEKAFYNCTSLTSVTIPDSVTSIGYGAFSGCTNLSRIIVHNNPNVTVNDFKGTLWYDMRERRQWGVCQHCGSEFKGLFNKVCSKCGKPKDY